MANLFVLLLIFAGHSSLLGADCPADVEQCNNQDPFATLFGSLNASQLSGSSILSESSTADSLRNACTTYEKYLTCSKSLNNDCLPEHDKRQSFFDFVCKSVLPNVDNATCWKSDSCKLTKIGDKSMRMSCQFLAAMQLQIDCALEQSETCHSPSIEFLRQARTDNFNLMSTMDCNDDDEQQRAINSTTLIPKCSEKQNLNAKVCEKDVENIAQYLSNDTFWIDVISNNSIIKELCDRVFKHQKCVETTMDQSDDNAAQMPCIFDNPMQNFPAFMQTMCNNEILRYQLYPACKSVFVESSVDFTPQEATSSEVLCSMFKSSITYLNSLKMDNVQCAEMIRKVESNIMEDAQIFKCFPESTTKAAFSVSTPRPEACAMDLMKQCEKFHLNFISVTSNAMTTKDYCSAKQLLKSCVTCDFINFPNSVESIHNFVCGPGANDYEKSRACLFSASEDQNVKNCLDMLGAVLRSNDSSIICPTVNKLVNCTFPVIDRLCGQTTGQFHLNVMHNFAMTSIPDCHLEMSLTMQEDALSTILAYESCTSNEQKALNECAEPFRKLLSDLESTAKGGLSSLIASLKNVTNAVKEGCKLRRNFQSCVKKSLSPSTACQISSCSIKVGDTACSDNVTAKSLEKDIRCMFTLITDAKFQQCMKIFPKDTFNNLAKLKPYFPQFITCIREPVLRKCGERSWQLARSFTSGKNDTSCVLDFDHTMTHVEFTTESIVNSTESETLCTTERLDQFEDCANVLGDFKPMPIMMFDDQSKIDKACPLYNGYQNCLKKYKCHYPLAEAYKSLLYNICTTYYDAYKSNAFCLKRVANNNKVQSCVNTFRSTDLRSVSPGLADLGCKTVTDLLKCAGDAADLACGQSGLDFLYNVYRPFAQKFSPTCSPSRTDIGPPVRECTREQRDIYYECRNRITLNPISILNDTGHFDRTCSHFNDEFQTCTTNAPCLPQPAHQAFNDTMTYLCSTEQTKTDFDAFNPCLSRVAESSAGVRCSSAFDNITWDDPGKIVCRKLNQALDCGYPLINQAKCHQDSMILIYNVYSLMAMRYRTGCVLNVPPNVRIPDRKNENATFAQPIFVTDNMPTTTAPSVEATTKGASGHTLHLLPVAICSALVILSSLL